MHAQITVRFSFTVDVINPHRIKEVGSSYYRIVVFEARFYYDILVFYVDLLFL
jgi:hypothetical protein